MNKELTEIICILDMSGSMYGLTSDTIGGFNSFIEEQKKDGMETRVTLTLFNHEIKNIYEGKNIQEVPELTGKAYHPDGCTALLDAVGITVDQVGQRLYNIPENERPGKIIVLVVTDGMENASREYNAARIKDMIKHQQNKYSWEFVFSGAGIDAWSQHRNLGISARCSINYQNDSYGTRNLYKSMSRAVSNVKSGNSLDNLQVDYDKDLEEEK